MASDTHTGHRHRTSSIDPLTEAETYYGEGDVLNRLRGGRRAFSSVRCVPVNRRMLIMQGLKEFNRDELNHWLHGSARRGSHGMLPEYIRGVRGEADADRCDVSTAAQVSY